MVRMKLVAKMKVEGKIIYLYDVKQLGKFILLFEI